MTDDMFSDLVSIAGDIGGVCCTPDSGAPGGYRCEALSGQASCEGDLNRGRWYPGLTCEQVQCGKRVCCLEDGECRMVSLGLAGSLECSQLGGQTEDEGSQCVNWFCKGAPNPFPPTGCVSIGVDSVPIDGYEWTLDRCAMVPFASTVRSPKHQPAGGRHEREHYGPDDIEWVSARPMRANEHNAGVEPCKHHFARAVVLPNGDWVIVFCGRPRAVDAMYSPTSVALFGSLPYTPDGMPLARGDMIAVGAYETPLWTEGYYYSELGQCGTVE